jgi:hypothetical protein
MPRETARELALEDEVTTPIYQDQKQIVRKLGAHIPEMFVGQVLGAGGAGGSLLNVPFEPAMIDISEATGPTLVRHMRGGALPAAVDLNLITGAVNAAVPVITKVGNGDWTIALPTALAPDGDTATVVVYGYRDVGGSL